MEIFEKIKEERIRLGFTQEQFATAIGATRRSVINWECGDAQPPAQILAAMAAHGADVLYILTSQRSKSVAPQSLLPEGDRILLDNFHAAPAGVQAGVKTTLGAFSAQTGSGRRKAA